MVDPTFAFLATPWQTGAAALAPTEQSARARWCVQSAASKASEAAAAASAQGKKPAAVVRRRQCADHTYDRNRAESDLTNETMGVSIGLGMACETQPSAGLVRDWNEELQCCREMPANTVHASIARSRALCKVLSDFETVATECAVAVAHGHVPPINPLDAPDAHVYVHNNVFFSLAVDGRGTYETCGGDAAAYSAASHDLRGVMELSRADVLANTVIGTQPKCLPRTQYDDMRKNRADNFAMHAKAAQKHAPHQAPLSGPQTRSGDDGDEWSDEGDGFVIRCINDDVPDSLVRE